LIKKLIGWLTNKAETDVPPVGLPDLHLPYVLTNTGDKRFIAGNGDITAIVMEALNGIKAHPPYTFIQIPGPDGKWWTVHTLKG
jgi:hypothetical protein